jgi:glycosyltransferase involved in cell wall biosynthesis
MNTAEADGIAKMYNVHPERVACVYNPKDFRSFHNFHEFAWKISRQLDLPNKDAIQIFPHCSTRMDAKGIDAVIRVFAALKKSGKKVALIMANANARGVQAEIKAKKDFMKSLGLEENKDFLFTSDWTSNRPLPRAAVANLFLVSNLFVFASWREVCPNVLLEGEISGNLLAINAMNPALPEFAGENHIKFTADAKTPGVPDGVSGDLTRIEYHSGEERYFDWIAAIIGDHLPDRSYQWAYSYEKIWETQMRPLLYGGIGGDRKEAA